MLHILVLHAPPHLKVEAVSDEHKRNVVEGVGISLAKFIRPDQQRVIQQAAVPAWLWRVSQALGQMGQLFAVPLIDLGQLLLRIFLAVRFV